MDSEGIFDCENYDGPIELAFIVEHIEKISLYNLKKNEARKNWNLPFSLERYETFYKDRERLVNEEECVYQERMSSAKASYFNDFGIDVVKRAHLKFFPQERAIIMTKLLHRHVPGTKPREFLQVYAEVNTFINKQHLAVIDYVEGVAIPKLIKHRSRDPKRVKRVAKKACPPE